MQDCAAPLPREVCDKQKHGPILLCITLLVASCEGGNKELKCGGLLSLPPRSINHENEQGYKLRLHSQCTRAEAAARASSGDRNSRDVRRGLSVVAR